MSDDLMERLSHAGRLLDRWADGTRGPAVRESTDADDGEPRHDTNVRFVDVKLEPATVVPGRRRSVVVGGIAAAMLLLVALVALAPTGGDDVGVASGGEVVALVPDGGVRLTDTSQGPIEFVADDVQGPLTEDRIAETGTGREVKWEIDGGTAALWSRLVPDPALAEGILGGSSGVEQEVRGRPGRRVDASNTASMADSLVILHWEEVPGLHITLHIDTTQPDPVRAALEIAEELDAVDEAGWIDRVGATMAEQRVRDEEFAAQQGKDAREVSEARIAEDPNLRRIAGMTIGGSPFEVSSLDLELFCLSLAGSDTGCMSAGPRTARDVEPTPPEDPTHFGVGEDDQQLIFGGLGRTATQVVATTSTGEPTTATPLVNDGLWALPIAPGEQPATIVFLDENGDEVHRIEW